MWHLHNWYRVWAHQLTYKSGWPATLVGHRCTKCDKTLTEELDGHWTLAELAPNDR